MTSTSRTTRDKSLSRCVGEFFGHIVRAVKKEPRRTVVDKQVREVKQSGVIYRRTTTDEIIELPPEVPPEQPPDEL
ncbi:MAG: hypothetical protein KAS72_11675 [Phycisphaerales bacterium]|nr:hypothetical protein [Phycisphaerales bacterium]